MKEQDKNELINSVNKYLINFEQSKIYEKKYLFIETNEKVSIKFLIDIVINQKIPKYFKNVSTTEGKIFPFQLMWEELIKDKEGIQNFFFFWFKEILNFEGTATLPEVPDLSEFLIQKIEKFKKLNLKFKIKSTNKTKSYNINL